MKVLRFGAVVGLAAMAALTFAQLNSMDRRFVREVGQGGNFEVAANMIGRMKAESLEVKQHSIHMVTDHTQSNAELANWARKNRVRLPKTMDSSQRAITARLRSLSGRAFDKYHIETQLKAHQHMLALFKKEVAQGRNKSLVNWARGKIMKIEEHLHMWRRVSYDFRG